MDELLRYADPSLLTQMVTGFIPKLVAAALVLLLFWILWRVTRVPIRAGLTRAGFADALIHLIVDNLYKSAVFLLGLVMAASQLGIHVGAALAGIGVVGVAVGFAAQETLANMIAGFLVFWDRPFKIGDYITAHDLYGEVTAITMRTTRIRTMENTYVVIPNSKIIGEMLVNHSMYGETRVNVPVGIAYKEQIGAAREVLLGAVRGLEGVMAEPAPTVVVAKLDNSSVNLLVRVWIDNASDERPVFHRVMEATKVALDQAGIEIPFPHLQLFVDDVRDRVWAGAARLGAPK